MLMKEGRTTRKHKRTAHCCFGVSYCSLVQLPDILQMWYITSATLWKSHVLAHSYSFMWVWKVASSFPRKKNINFRNLEECWWKYILSKTEINFVCLNSALFIEEGMCRIYFHLTLTITTHWSFTSTSLVHLQCWVLRNRNDFASL